jgi:hypothetical protein
VAGNAFYERHCESGQAARIGATLLVPFHNVICSGFFEYGRYGVIVRWWPLAQGHPSPGTPGAPRHGTGGRWVRLPGGIQ